MKLELIEGHEYLHKLEEFIAKFDAAWSKKEVSAISQCIVKQAMKIHNLETYFAKHAPMEYQAFLNEKGLK